MPLAFGQNATELGRNIIDLEQLKNARDAQQAQVQNQFLAQLNQARLGREQIAAQSQAQQNALMMQALQQRMQQSNLDRDFGLRQTAQGNQSKQFADQLALENKRVDKPQYFPGMLTEAERENNRRALDNQAAKGISEDAKFALGLLLKQKTEALAENAKRHFWQSDKSKDIEKLYATKVDELITGLGKNRGALSIILDPTDPFKTRFDPILMPQVEMPGFGRGSGGSPAPVDRPVSPGIGPIPINPSGVFNVMSAQSGPQAQPGGAQSQSSLAGFLNSVLPSLDAKFNREWYNPFKDYRTNAPAVNAPEDSYFDPLGGY